MSATSRRLVERFVSLCEVASPTGEERAVADAVVGQLAEIGIEAHEDATAAAARAGAGNLIARLPAAGEDAAERGIAIFSHLDTVPHDGPIRVVEDGGVLRSEGETILGADNKAAVAVAIELAARWRERGEHPAVPVELVFTVAEEEGLRGASCLELASLASGTALVLDHASDIGEVITSAPTHNRIRASFTGAEAHAGIHPEHGRSAILAAARAITTMPAGRIDERTTANVGIVSGGTATNVVARSCTLEAEVRCLDHDRAQAVTHEAVQACADAAASSDCDLDVDVEEMFRAYEVPRGSRALELARRGLADAGFEPVEVATGGGSDANALALKGLDCVLLANGTYDAHTPNERVGVADLEAMVSVLDSIVARAATC